MCVGIRIPEVRHPIPNVENTDDLGKRALEGGDDRWRVRGGVLG